MLRYTCDVCSKTIKIFMYIEGDSIKYRCTICEKKSMMNDKKINKKAFDIYNLLKKFQLLDKEKQDDMILSYECAANISK